MVSVFFFSDGLNTQNLHFISYLDEKKIKTIVLIMLDILPLVSISLNFSCEQLPNKANRIETVLSG